MNTFKPGDEVVCIDNYGAEYGLDLYRYYTVREYADWSDPKEIFLEDTEMYWMENRFELLSEWEKHQRKVDPVTELELAKMKIKALQNYKDCLRIVAYNAVGAYEDQHTSDVDTHRAMMMLKDFLET